MTSTFLGLAVALAGFYCIVVAGLMGQYSAFAGYRWYAVGFLGLLSISLAVAWFRSVRAARIEPQETEATERGNLFRGWCILLAVLCLISVFLQPLRPFGRAKPVQVATRPVPKPTPPPTPEPPPPPAPRLPVKFRELKIQGILFQPDKRLVIIEGDSYAAGEMIYDLRIKSVQRNGMTVEKDGVEKIIRFND